jgi:thiol-disulfide isomerase/thioredoxin
MKFRAVLWALVGLCLATGVHAELAVGATRAEVEAAYGKPKGTTQIGTREILSYEEGRVFLDQGRLIKTDFANGAEPSVVASMNTAGTTASESERHGTTAVVSSARDGWYTDFDLASAAAREQHKNILALFTGSDWCPPCMAFEREAAHNPRFLQAVQQKFVLLFLDYPRTKPQSASVRQKNQALQDRYQVEAFPTFLALSADGSKSKLVSLGLPASGDLVQSMIDLILKADPAGPAKSRFQLFAALGVGLIAVIWWLKK